MRTKSPSSSDSRPSDRTGEDLTTGQQGNEAKHQPQAVKMDALRVPVWEGPVDPEELNAEILRIIRRDDAQRPMTETAMARRYGMTRQHMHNLHHEDMHLTVSMMTKWCNGRHVGFDFLATYAAQRLRRRHARQKEAGSSKRAS